MNRHRIFAALADLALAVLTAAIVGAAVFAAALYLSGRAHAELAGLRLHRASRNIRSRISGLRLAG